MMFVCGQCWRNGQLSEADKNKKYCTAKARHTWVQSLERVICGQEVNWSVRVCDWRRPHKLSVSFCLRWAKDRRVVLVSSHERKKWTTVRPLPTKKPIPSQFEVWVKHFFLTTKLSMIKINGHTLFFFLRFACMWQLARSVSTLGTARLLTA